MIQAHTTGRVPRGPNGDIEYFDFIYVPYNGGILARSCLKMAGERSLFNWDLTPQPCISGR